MVKSNKRPNRRGVLSRTILSRLYEYSSLRLSVPSDKTDGPMNLQYEVPSSVTSLPYLVSTLVFIYLISFCPLISIDIIFCHISSPILNICLNHFIYSFSILSKTLSSTNFLPFFCNNFSFLEFNFYTSSMIIFMLFIMNSVIFTRQMHTLKFYTGR